MPDDDPIFRLDVSDCTVHVLTSIALAQSRDWSEAIQNMIAIHYKIDENGEQVPSYESRWHFTSDRILHNPITSDITKEMIDRNSLAKVDLTLNIKSDDTRLLDIHWTKGIEISYIPNNLIDQNLLNKLPDICGIAFVRESYIKNGLLVAHEGILIDQMNLIHASSEYGETVNIDFIDYYFRNGEPLFDGIMIYKIGQIY